MCGTCNFTFDQNSSKGTTTITKTLAILPNVSFLAFTSVRSFGIYTHIIIRTRFLTLIALIYICNNKSKALMAVSAIPQETLGVNNSFRKGNMHYSEITKLQFR